VTAPRTSPSAAVSTAGRRRGRPGLDREAVLAGSVAVFNERGFDGTSMEDLARRLGISKSAIYHHVSGKDALLATALDRALDGLEEAAARARERDGRAADRLEQLLRESVVVLVERLPYVTLLLRVRGNTDVERRAMARRRRFDRMTAGLVAEAIAEGGVRADLDPAVAARLLFGLVNSLTEWYRPRPGDDGGAIADAVVHLALDGLRAARTT
jgi:AcrR family transcriptional regulator